ncbi:MULTISPECIES: hypothetical protein [Bacillus]|uniref:hypothetical protein n=1 Tax=Bacillus TaxID=1386 RepID=UPI0007057CAE|nr:MULTISPECIES: hypothetical protein [Bacillus]ALM27830.1 hypothetical protein AKO65_07315 [Bacillus altitudinis]ALM44371.1 hypothetical protein AMR71_03630 [Bacillus altitudinis]ANY95846.1 hypothetical protein AKO66_03630 [Bacillus altitudinis]MCA0162963.1 hypothetical protein [Bacillus sp. RAR_M1_44]USK23801.1 hypothetical protein LIS79_16110 [Bacillus altitudinis]
MEQNEKIGSEERLESSFDMMLPSVRNLKEVIEDFYPDISIKDVKLSDLKKKSNSKYGVSLTNRLVQTLRSKNYIFIKRNDGLEYVDIDAIRKS